MKIAQHPSPNCGERRLGAKPDLIVIHYTAMADCRGALDWLCDPTSEVSAHYLITTFGHATQMVDEKDRAWHAGAGAWGGCEDVNSRSIGIELSNDGYSPFAAAQINALEDLLVAIMTRWSIPAERVIGHSDMAGSRKIDPGPRFDWRRLARNGLSVWPEPREAQAAMDMNEFCQYAEQFGYPVSGDAAQVLDVFRMRFFPRKTGDLDTADMAAMVDLANRFPVDRAGNQA